MSGGRFNYADNRAKDEIFGWKDKQSNVFEDREISDLVWDMFNLIHDYEKKWLNNRGVRVKRIVDEAVEKLRQELYETYGIEKKLIN